MSMIIQGTTLETIEQAVPMIIEETSQEMKEQLEVVYMTGQLVLQARSLSLQAACRDKFRAVRDKEK